MKRVKNINWIVAILGALCVTLFVIIVVNARGSYVLAGYGQRIELTVDSGEIATDLTNYPLPLIIDSTAGISDDDLTVIFDELGANSKKLAVTEDDGETQLYVEVEYWDDINEKALLWVSSSTFVLSSSSDTTLYLYYDNDVADNTTYVGDPGDVPEVWGAFTARWGFQDDPSTDDLVDSTGNGYTGTMGGSMTSGDLIDGFIGKAIDFDGTDDYFVITRPITGDWYVEAYVYPIDGETHAEWWGCGGIFGREKGGVVNDFGMGYDGTLDDFVWGTGNPDKTKKTSDTYVNDWYQVVWRRDKSEADWWGYVNGSWKVSEFSSSTANLDAASTVWIGKTYEAFTGRIDELRVSTNKKNDTWFTAGWDAMQDNLIEYSVVEEIATLTPTATNTHTPTPTATPTPPAIVMGDPSDSSVPDAVSTAVATALASYRPDSELGLSNSEMANMWAVTYSGESSVEDYYWVSVAGMVVDDTGDLDGWELGDSLWNGLAIAKDNGDTTYTAHLYGSVGYENMLATAGLADISFPDTGGSGSYTYYLPFPPGRVAYYGSKGVHDAGHGYGGYGWRAVDFVGGAIYADNVFPNSVYVSQSGTVSFVCKDEIQTWVQIGNFLYGHLNDNETLDYEIYHSQGSYLGSLVPGSHDTNCGRMDQRDTSYHLHIGFLPDGNYFQWEDYTLNLSTECFERGNEEICPNDYLLAGWSANVIDVPTPRPTVTPGGPTVTPGPGIPVGPSGDRGGDGGQIWDGFINASKRLVQERVNMLNDPDYDPADMPNEVSLPIMFMDGVRIALRSVYVLAYSNINLTITIIVFTLILIMEIIRILRAVWMGIKAMVPFIG